MPGESGTVKQCECSKNSNLDKIPPKFKDVDLLGYRKTKAMLISPEKKKIELPLFIERNFDSNFLICGDFDKGKTHLLYAQCKMISEICPDKKMVVYRESDLLNQLQRASYDDHEYSEFILLNHHLKNNHPTHIFIDDLGKTPVTEDRLFQLYNFLDIIYSCNYGLTITSNFKIGELERKWGSNHGGSIISRLKMICQWIYIFDDTITSKDRQEYHCSVK